MSHDDDSSRNKRSSEDDVDPDDHPVKRQRNNDQDQSEIRLLLPSRNAGAIIGKGGENIKRLRQDFQSSISLPDSNTAERLMIIKAKSGTICDVVEQVMGILEKAEREEADGADIRFLIHQSHAGRIIGKAGARVKELREETGAQIKVFTEMCPNSTDRTCQLIGKTGQVVSALGRILELLEGNAIKGPVVPYNPNNAEEMYANDYGGFPDRRGRGGPPRGGRDRGGDDRGPRRMSGGGGRSDDGRRRDFDDYNRGGRDFDRGGRGFDRGGRDFGGSRGFDRMSDGMRGGGARGGFVPSQLSSGKTIVSQVSIPKHLAGAIIGKAGMRIRQVQAESGTVIKMDEASDQSDERIITIHGTHEQIQYAQYLLQLAVKQHANI